MMPRPCASIAEAYIDSLRAGFTVSQEENGCHLTTPFYLPDNSRISLSVTYLRSGEVNVSDVGETFDRLFLTGINLSPTDWRVISSSKRFGVPIDDGEIALTVPATDVASAIHRVSHAILDVSYLSSSRAHRAPAEFGRAVENSIRAHQWRFEQGYEIVGRSSKQKFDFVIMEHRPVLVEALTAREPSRANVAAKLSAFKVADTRQLPANEFYRYLCLLDDRDQERRNSITETALQPLEGYFDRVMRWSEFQELDTLAIA